MKQPAMKQLTSALPTSRFATFHGLRLLTLLSCLVALLAPVAQTLAEDTPAAPLKKTHIFFFSKDYPPNVIFGFPIVPEKQTLFYQYLDKYMAESGKMELVRKFDDADVQVHIDCAGIRRCTKLMVHVKSPRRNPLVSYQIPSSNNVQTTALRLVKTLSEKLDNIKFGGVGTYGVIDPLAAPATSVKTEPALTPSPQPAENESK
ncbi:MAG: hypothetical protein K2X01_06555 [Cyanobacteria bacterium]|nr:hypothetical protein [Cyanobacteriota bacterium]